MGRRIDILSDYFLQAIWKKMELRMNESKPAVNRVESFLLGLVLGVATLYGAMHFTVVRAKDGFHFIPKITAKLESPYVDVRALALEQWQRRQMLALSILKAKKGYLLEDHRLGAFKLSTQQRLDQLALDGSSRSDRL
jgi:hypothetical protein